MYVDDQDMPEEDMGGICDGCGMKRSEWKGNSGHGYVKDGLTYCCKGCAEETTCSCDF
jgi:hypothetical protein